MQERMRTLTTCNLFLFVATSLIRIIINNNMMHTRGSSVPSHSFQNHEPATVFSGGWKPCHQEAPRRGFKPMLGSWWGGVLILTSRTTLAFHTRMVIVYSNITNQACFPGWMGLVDDMHS